MRLFRKKDKTVAVPTVPTPTQISKVESESIKLDFGYTRNITQTMRRYLKFLVRYNPVWSHRKILSDFEDFCSSGLLNRYDLSAWFAYTSSFKELEPSGLTEYFESSNGVRVAVDNDDMIIKYDSYAYTIPIKDLKVNPTKLEFPTGILCSDGSLSFLHMVPACNREMEVK